VDQAIGVLIPEFLQLHAIRHTDRWESLNETNCTKNEIISPALSMVKVVSKSKD
jgi:hypothetical protein